MSQRLTFSIDEQVFQCSSETLKAPAFTVQSVPRNYELTWQAERAPTASINQHLAQNPNNVLLIDEKVWDLYGSDIIITADRVFKATATEAFKTLDGVTEVLDFLQVREFTKGEQLIVVGGGIIQDIGAFVGAIYKRGIPWIYFPTTLLSMADSCIGGKAGVNYKGAKNQLALFSTPYHVTIHPQFLTTLPLEAITSGMGEVLKLCIIGGAYFIELYQAEVTKGQVHSKAALQTLIMAALTVKKAIIEVDEFEINHRRSLNYGHTLGHAIEALSDYAIPHGQAVVIGMVLVNELSHQQGLLSAADLKQFNTLCYDLISDAVLQQLARISFNNIMTLLQKDKKTVGAVTSFAFMEAPGDTRFVKVARDAGLMAAIDNALQKILQRG